MPPAPSSIDALLAQARRECLSEVEREELLLEDNDDFSRPLNPRNEAAALDRLYARGGGAGDDKAALDALAVSYVQRTGGPARAGETQQQAPEVDADTAALAEWALRESASVSIAALAPALFVDPSNTAPARRGLAATRDLQPGDIALQLDAQKLAITYRTARESDLGRALSALGLEDESLALLWTMADRHDPESPHAPFWRALQTPEQQQEQQKNQPPDHLGTPLGAGVSDAAVERALGGTPLGDRCREARRHLQAAWEGSVAPAAEALVRAYPQHLRAEWFTRDRFLWAAELWYAYAMQLALPQGKRAKGGVTEEEEEDPVPALVPLASLANHGAWPHCVAFSDCRSGKQRLRVFRPVREGDELLISYGPYDNGELLLFYGFSIPANPFDARAVRRQLREGGGDGKDAAGPWRAAHAAALARVERALREEERGSGWTEAERAFFRSARVWLRGFLAAEAALA